MNEYRRKIEECKSAIISDSSNPELYNRWGDIIKDIPEEEQKEALADYYNSIQQNLNTLDALNDYGILLISIGMYTDAIEIFYDILKKDSNYFFANFNLGIAYDKISEYEKSVDCYKMYIHINPDDIDGYYALGIVLEKLQKYEEAVEQYKRIIEIDPAYSDAYFGLGFALECLGEYKRALEKYEEAHRADQDDPYPIHNIASLFEKQGRYHEANRKWEEVCNIYERGVEKKFTERDSDFFLYYGSIYQFTVLKDLKKAEMLYQKGLSIDPKNTDILTNMVQLCMSRRDELTKASCNDMEECSVPYEYCAAKEYYNRAIKKLNMSLKTYKTAEILVDIGNLNKELGNYKDAKENYVEVLKINSKNLKAVVGLGAIHMYNESYKEAIELFIDSTMLDPNNFDLRSNLAEAYLKYGRKEKAEQEYMKILSIAPCHIDSLIGIAQTSISMGEDANARKDFINADVMFSTADGYFKEIIQLIQHPSSTSKILTSEEKSSIYYSMGYNEVMMYETQKKQDRESLLTAIADFKKVDKGSSNYYKAQRAITKIDKNINDKTEKLKGRGTFAVVISVFIVFTLTQLCFFFGRPVFDYSKYALDKVKFEKVTSKLNLDIYTQHRLKRIVSQQNDYTSGREITQLLQKELGDSIAIKIKPEEFMEGSRSIRIIAFQPIESGYYTLLSFGCILFMIAGFYLSKITKFKVGSLELEKSTIDQITTMPSLGISR